jgi:hypothetical protein
MILNSDGRCVCPQGTVVGPNGQCVKQCPPGETMSPTGLCIKQPMPVCPPPKVMNPATGQCMCPPGTKPNPLNGQCV